MPNDPQYTDPNPGISRRLILDTTLNDAASRNGINQIRGLDSKGSLGSGIPKHVTNVGASVAQAATGTTSTVRVTFHRDPSDKNYSAAAVWVKGYQGNNNPVQVAQSYESPATFVLNNTGEPVSILVQAAGNGGQAPLSSAPTTGITLPKSTIAGYGTGTTVAYTPASPPPASNLAFSTAGLGYFWSFAGVNEAGGQPQTTTNLTQGTSGLAASANRVICFHLVLKAAYTVRTVSMFVSGAAAGGASCAIYDSTGTTNLLDAGANAFNTANVATLQTVTLGTPVVLPAGVYWFACSATSATPGTSVGASLSAGAAGYNSFFNTGFVRAGSSANALSGGAMPSSLGAITALPTGTFSCPGFFFQV